MPFATFASSRFNETGSRSARAGVRGNRYDLDSVNRRLHARHAALLVALAGVAACEEREAGSDGQPDPRGPAARDTVPAAPATGAASPSTAAPAPATPLPDAPPLPSPPRGLPALASPPHNPTTAEKVELGRMLFFDPRLSGTGKTSCASCHQPQRGWADGIQRARTDAGHPNLRHTPSLYNTGYQREWAWDGGMPTLEAHILSHWKGQLGRLPGEAGALLGRAPGYAARFARAFGSRPERDHAAEALAAFVRTITSGDSPLDRHEGDVAGALTVEARAGREIFTRRAACATCHPPPLYTDLSFHDRGIASVERARDPGRMRVTADPRHLGAFKTPGLRGLLHTAPYFHDGSAATLEAAVTAELSRENLTLSSAERAQLLAFLRALSPPLTSVPRPELPPAL